MTIESAISHIYSGENANCASSSLHAILPHKPEAKHEQVALYNEGALFNLVTITCFELARRTILPRFFFLQENETPSECIRRVERLREPRHTYFGGYLITKEYNPGHVIGILKIHENKKATIFDTAPHSDTRKRSNPYVRKVPFQTLDRRITKKLHAQFGAPMVLLLGWQLTGDTPEIIKQKFTEYKQLLFSKSGKVHNLMEIVRTMNLDEQNELLQHNGKSKKQIKREKHVVATHTFFPPKTN